MIHFSHINHQIRKLRYPAFIGFLLLVLAGFLFYSAFVCADEISASPTPLASSAPITGACGKANRTGALSAPTTDLCAAGQATALSGTGPWKWSCKGSNGGSTASCSAWLIINGICGPANGIATLRAPTSALCSAGVVTKVSGSGPWTWSCIGSNGPSAHCSAPLLSKAVFDKAASDRVVAINAGGPEYTDKSGIVYRRDRYYSGGKVAGDKVKINGTEDSILYQTERFGTFAYNMPLSNGKYIVTLKFAELYWNAPGKCLFNVKMQGIEVLTQLDVFAKAGGKDKAYDVSIPVSVTDGILNISFTPVLHYPKVNAILIERDNR